MKEKPKQQGTFSDTKRTLEGLWSGVEDVLNRARWPLWWPWAPIEPFTEEPETDIVDTGDTYEVTIDLPGVAKKDIQISATRDTIELSAVRTETDMQSQAKYVSKERGCAAFRRVLALSDEIIPEQTKASFAEGILTLVLKKKPPEPERERVKVEIL